MKCLCFFLFFSAIANAAPTFRESFDLNWKFARFGKMPDGSHRMEPGEAPVIARASSEESGNPAVNAVDGNPATRWCASSAAKNQWLIVDLGETTNLGGVRIHWEKASDNPFRVDVSEDGGNWVAAVANRMIDLETETMEFRQRGRFVRVTVDGMPASWASIRQINALDMQGRSIAPRTPDAAELPPKPQDIAFDDVAWRMLDLPHDWAIEGPFRMEIENETGKLPWEGIGWYRKSFTAPSDLGTDRLFLDFDGAMSHAKVFVDGQMAGEWAYGYNSFRIDITPFINPGKAHLIAIRLENLPESTRWYPGAGIYRHVYLTRTPAVAIGHWGVYVTTPEIHPDRASVEVETSVENSTNQSVEIRIAQQILDGENVVSNGENTIHVAAKSTAAGKASLMLSNPRRWDIDTPNRYIMRTRIYRDAELLDEKLTSFGIRKIAWDAERGFLLNDRKVVLHGVCQHHDLGPLGSAVHTRAIERQLEILKEMGANSVRTAHNPPAPELLELCDRMGILVIDEIFDIWKLQKYGKVNGYNIAWDAWHEKDVRNFMLRDRNHPSIIAWSTGNEIPELGRPDYHWVSLRLRDLIRQYDVTRPVTAGSNDPSAIRNGFQNTVDVFGVNYHLGSYPATLNAMPDKAVYASETSSTVSTRGEYFFPVSWDQSKGFFEFQVSSYDLYAPGWANRPDLQFEALDKHPRFAGEYVWTGFDYIGEPTPYNQDQTNALNFRNPEERAKAMEELARLGNRAPSRSSYFGIIDLAGFPKDRYYLYQSRWRPELPVAHILPHWNWPERVGKATPVHVYTNGDEAELFLNGTSQGRRKMGEPHAYRLVWDDVVYQPGELKVIVTKNEKPWATANQVTTGPVARIEVLADRTTLNGDGRDLSYLTIQAVDANGQIVPRTRLPVHVSVAGPVEIIGICNGDPTDLTTMKPVDPSSATIGIFNGLAQVVLRGRRGEAGQGKVHLKAENLEVAETHVVIQPAP